MPTGDYPEHEAASPKLTPLRQHEKSNVEPNSSRARRRSTGLFSDG